MNYRKLGSSDIEISPISFGAWQMADSGYWGDSDPKDAERAVQTALDAGINLFDTAEVYADGESERALGSALGKRRAEIHVATKVAQEHCEPSKLHEACENSLRRLQTDYIDIYQVHWPSRDVPFEDTAATMIELQEQGKIRAMAVSNFGAGDLQEWLRHAPCASNQLGYNLLTRSIEYEVVPACLKHDVGILAYMPLMQGLLAGKWERTEEIPAKRRRTRHFNNENGGTGTGCEADVFKAISELKAVAADLGCSVATLSIAALINRPGLASVIIGAREPHQVTRNLAALDVELDSATVARVDAITEPIKTFLGRNCDMWASDEQSRMR